MSNKDDIHKWEHKNTERKACLLRDPNMQRTGSNILSLKRDNIFAKKAMDYPEDEW